MDLEDTLVALAYKCITTLCGALVSCTSVLFKTLIINALTVV